MKITGAEFKEWHDTAWPEGLIWGEESTLDDGRDIYDEVTGNLIFDPAETVIVPDWWCLEPEERTPDFDRVSVRNLIKKWRKNRDTVFLMVKVPKDAEDEARMLFTNRKWPVS